MAFPHGNPAFSVPRSSRPEARVGSFGKQGLPQAAGSFMQQLLDLPETQPVGRNPSLDGSTWQGSPGGPWQQSPQLFQGSSSQLPSADCQSSYAPQVWTAFPVWPAVTDGTVNPVWPAVTHGTSVCAAEPLWAAASAGRAIAVQPARCHGCWI